jgi:dTDP-4-amino-4,6-dideoxygalactose transaminase
MFNNYSELIKLKKICEKNEILLIEDNAIYLGNYHQDNENKIYSGSFGDVSIFSFGIMKNISAIFGGALVTSNIDIYNFAQEKNNSFQNFPSSLYFKKFLLFIILKLSLSKLIYNFFFFYVLKIAHNFKIKFLLKLIYPSLNFKLKKYILPEYKSKISNLSLKIIYQIIKDPDFETQRKKRKENNLLYYKLLDQNQNIKQIELLDFDFQNFLDYPIIVKKNKDKLVELLFKKGLETRYHFYSNFEKYLNLKNNNVSKYYEENLICLPSHSEIEEKKIKKYCKEINNFYLNE